MAQQGDEKPPKPPLNPVPPPMTQRERLEREQEEMQERLKAKPQYPLCDDGAWDKRALFILGACTLVGAAMLGVIVYLFVF